MVLELRKFFGQLLLEHSLSILPDGKFKTAFAVFLLNNLKEL